MEDVLLSSGRVEIRADPSKIPQSATLDRLRGPVSVERRDGTTLIIPEGAWEIRGNG